MRRRSFVLVGLGAVLAGAWVGLGRPLFRVSHLADAPFRTPVEVTQAHIDWLRNLRFAWSPLIEGGAPMVDPVAPYGPDAGMPFLAMHREVCDLLIWLLANRPLEPGRYPLAHMDNAVIEAVLRQELAALPPERIEAVLAPHRLPSDDGTFAFTQDHRSLLPGLAWMWPGLDIAPVLTRRTLIGAPVPVVDFKRPFGDATAFEQDMADRLGLPVPLDRPEEIWRLYAEMWPALQVFVQHVPLELGPLEG